MPDPLGDLQRSVGDLAMSEPGVAVARGMASVGQTLQGAYDRAVAALTPTPPRKRTTDITLPRDIPRRRTKARAVTSPR